MERDGEIYRKKEREGERKKKRGTRLHIRVTGAHIEKIERYKERKRNKNIEKEWVEKDRKKVGLGYIYIQAKDWKKRKKGRGAAIR